MTGDPSGNFPSKLGRPLYTHTLTPMLIVRKSRTRGPPPLEARARISDNEQGSRPRQGNTERGARTQKQAHEHPTALWPYFMQHVSAQVISFATPATSRNASQPCALAKETACMGIMVGKGAVRYARTLRGDRFWKIDRFAREGT